jgi:hypothetical protein
MIDFYYLLTVDDETRRVPVPVGVATDEDAVLDYVTGDGWATGEVVSASWPSPLPSPE